MKGVGGRQSRSSAGMKNVERVVFNIGKDETAVFTGYFKRLYDPPMNADRHFLREYEAQHEHIGQAEREKISET